MIAPRQQQWIGAWWGRLVERWSRTPGYLKWASGLLLGALVRVVLGALFPQHWERISHPLLDRTMPIWLAVVGLIVVLVLERALPVLYREVRSQGEQQKLRTLFGVRWATPPEVEEVQGPYCTIDPTLLRGILWSGDSSPTLWICPTCKREFSTPEFPDIRREAEQQLGRRRRASG
jgi:hypothetical protein